MDFLKQNQVKIEQYTVEHITNNQTLAPILKKMIPHVFTGGKMIRGSLFIETLKGFGETPQKEHWLIAGAIEMVHTYSLVHDDLPAMDNDDFRRGKPTLHKQYNEALAILAGDALLTYAFTLLSSTPLPPKIMIQLIQQLSEAAGGSGMIYGQILDIDITTTPFEQHALEQLHNLKTGRMITLPLMMAGTVLKRSSEEIDHLTQFGDLIGQAFQAKDDLLDVTSDLEKLGKTPGKDQQQHKLTYITLLGVDQTIKLIDQLTEKALNIIKPYQLSNLEILTRYLKNREQ